MKVSRIARGVMLAAFLLIGFSGLKAQNGKSIAVAALNDQPGWFSVQFDEASSPYALKAFVVEQGRADAIIQRLFVDEVHHKATIEMVNKELSAVEAKALLEKKLVNSSAFKE